MLLLNNSRIRSIAFGAAGGVIGWMLAEVLIRDPHSFMAAVEIGSLAGLGIGIGLGVAEGFAISSLRLALRGGLVGLVIGLIGGGIGASVAQLGYRIATASETSSSEDGGTTRTVFSSEVQKRLTQAGARSGEIEIALVWENTNDLDLHVLDPTGEEISFNHRIAASGGELDVDRNAGCDQNITSKPVEHVVWDEGLPPKGTYHVAVHHYQNCGDSDPTPFQVIVKVGNDVITSASGSLTFKQPIVRVATFDYPAIEETQVLEEAQVDTGGFFARVLGWAIFGLLVACAEGIRRRSPVALRNAAIGGLVGGAIGGVLFQFIAGSGLPDIVSRLVGFAILGASIGLFITLVEQALSAYLTIRNGRYEGRQIFIDRPRMRIGRNDALEIYLGGDMDVAEHHATLERDGNHVWIAPADGTVTVNGTSIERQKLKHEDVVQMGHTTLVLRQRAGSAKDGGTPQRSPSAATTSKSPPPPPPPRRNS